MASGKFPDAAAEVEMASGKFPDAAAEVEMASEKFPDAAAEGPPNPLEPARAK
jgi:hypothetical protein